ncbi:MULTISPECIES: acetyl-CoA carboxylase biotin carboxyl carrier protein [Anaerostipes]|uniref:Biotin carboxyl carrier protein of acetyl-CoA carboxylase n=1 Tax=Anaerostipes butyraticus TaxID=645466 RepID=A0A916Q7F1_9FIRM|nr:MULTISPECIES: acetyl-CoA carboxylase biotin carboxyl carrier protein [Anaerostipes]GFO85722.1 acetyl-CoA carboxylase biotin carboxyl carrier protein subunit [Anaerostipes butyraticus]HJC82737.1 acetyl-CoA carboxylase biotin carboxyl carrier protein [Candidatus Anaerostipes avicola]
MKIEEMKELIQAVSDSEVDEFKYSDEKCSVRIMKNKTQVVAAEAVPAAAAAPAPAAAPAAPEEKEPEVEGNQVKAPLVGTFYAAPSEGADPFVSVGDTVKKGQVIGIVEAMKLMNEVESDYDGTVAEILVENGEMVEYGQPLIVVK